MSEENYRDTIITLQEGGDSMKEKEADLLNEVYREISTVLLNCGHHAIITRSLYLLIPFTHLSPCPAPHFQVFS